MSAASGVVTNVFGSNQASEDLFPMAGHLGTSLGAVDAYGNIAEQTSADAFGNLNQTTNLKQSHLYTGEYFDADSQLTYLRARWYDAKMGRFISADPFEGRQQDPRSLNRYSYAHNDPVHMSDPTGGFSMGETGASMSVGATLGATALPNIGLVVLTRIAAQLLRVGARSAPLIKILARTCAANPRDANCLGDLPTFFLGDDYRDHTQFVALAQASMSPNVLTRSTRPSGAWYRAKPECRGLVGGVTGLDCDEYPYGSTLEGGPDNYEQGTVALEPVAIPDNRGAGGKLRAFYGKCGLMAGGGTKSRFFVAPFIGVPTTFWTCAR